MSVNCIQCGTGTRNGPDLLCEECRGKEFVPVKQVIRSLGDVYDWFQSDEEHPKPILDVVREVAAELRGDRQDVLKYEAVIKDLLTLCHRLSVDEEIGLLADKADNYSHAAKLNLPTKAHVEQQAMGMKVLASELRKLAGMVERNSKLAPKIARKCGVTLSPLRTDDVERKIG